MSEAVFGDHFIQLQLWFIVVAYGMFATFFLTSIIMLKRYGKMFSIYSHLIIIVMNYGFLHRAIVYYQSYRDYGKTPFLLDNLDKDTPNFEKFVLF